MTKTLVMVSSAVLFVCLPITVLGLHCLKCVNHDGTKCAHEETVTCPSGEDACYNFISKTIMKKFVYNGTRRAKGCGKASEFANWSLLGLTPGKCRYVTPTVVYNPERFGLEPGDSIMGEMCLCNNHDKCNFALSQTASIPMILSAIIVKFMF